jgi:hypothetical protein
MLLFFGLVPQVEEAFEKGIRKLANQLQSQSIAPHLLGMDQGV